MQVRVGNNSLCRNVEWEWTVGQSLKNQFMSELDTVNIKYISEAEYCNYIHNLNS